MLITILSFIVVFTIITLVHEGGHLIASKRQGIQVHEFGIGFGPTLISFSRNNTTYKINLLPILGYVKIAGIDTEDPQEKETPENEKYFSKSPLQKFKSIFAGPLMNLVLGFLLFSLIYAISGVPTGISNELAVVSPGSEADKIGLLAGDRLISVDGKTFASPEKAVEIIHQNADKELLLGIERNNHMITAKATPKYNKQLKIGLIGFSLKPIYNKINPFVAVYYGLKETLGLMLTILLLLGRLLIGKFSFSDLAGPVGIAQITGQYAHQGILSLLSFLAFFNINVAVLNLLPLPALDGGRLFFIVLEAIRRKPISIENENKVHHVGMILLLSLLAVLTVNDFLRIILR